MQPIPPPDHAAGVRRWEAASTPMDAHAYDAWYETPRGRWIGERETALVLRQLAPRPGESLLDVGCGTGFFTRSLGAGLDGRVAGVDINPEWVRYARRCSAGRAAFAVADARSLPFPDASFDLVAAITVLCFIEPARGAIREMLRVARRRFAMGLLNRHSLLYLQKGRGGGDGGYRGARWHTPGEVRRLFDGLPVLRLTLRSAVHIPSAGPAARRIEGIWPSALATGAFLLAVGDVPGIPTGPGLSPA